MTHLAEQLNDILGELFHRTVLVAVVTSAIVSVFTSIATCLLTLYIRKRFFKRKKGNGEKSAQEQSQVGEDVTSASSSDTLPDVPDTPIKSSERVEKTPKNVQPNENIKCNPNKPLTHEERRRLKKLEEERRREERRQQKRKGDIPKPAKVTRPPEGTETTPLTVADGQLVVATIGKIEYYCCWTDGGKTYYMLNRDEKLISKAINNHTALIDPFCNKTGDSVEYGVAKTVVMEECGVLNADYTIKDKAIIKYK